jgi:hypothetical protein
MLRGLGFLIALLPLTVGIAAAADLEVLRNSCPWVRFPVGSWKQVRVTVESLDSQGYVTGRTITETKTTLESLDEQGVVLRVESTYEVRGKRISNEPQLIRQTFGGIPAGHAISVKQLPDETVTMDRRKLPCRVQQMEFDEGQRRRVNLIHYCETNPFILRSLTTVAEPDDKEPSELTQAEVVDLEKPIAVLGQVKNAAHVRVTHKNESGTTQTDSYTVAEVPGGEVSASSNKLDQDGTIVRRTTVELQGYGFESQSKNDDQHYRANRRDRRSMRKHAG